MKWRGTRHRRCGKQPMVAVFRGRWPAEMAATTDLASLPVSESAHSIPHAQTGLACKTRGQRRVLVVDDDEVIRRLIAANLRLEGFDVATAVDGQDCLEKAPAIAPDVITLDVTMPRLDGWETALRLRKCALTSHIKIVLITARDHEDNRTSHRHVDVDARLIKPFDVGEMIRIVRKLAGPTSAAFM
jgi:CheY-like chemotaxis protein